MTVVFAPSLAGQEVPEVVRRSVTNMTVSKTIGICDTQPVTIEGLQSLLRGCNDMQVIGAATSLYSGLEMVKSHAPSLVLIDKAFGLPAVMDWLSGLRGTGTLCAVWGISMNEAEALRLMQAGAHGVMRKTADTASTTTTRHSFMVIYSIRMVIGGANFIGSPRAGQLPAPSAVSAA